MRSLEQVNIRTNVRTYVLTYIRTGQTLYPLHNFVVRGDKNPQSADFCADHIDVITNFAVITNVVIKRVHCIF